MILTLEIEAALRDFLYWRYAITSEDFEVALNQYRHERLPLDHNPLLIEAVEARVDVGTLLDVGSHTFSEGGG